MNYHFWKVNLTDNIYLCEEIPIYQQLLIVKGMKLKLRFKNHKIKDQIVNYSPLRRIVFSKTDLRRLTATHTTIIPMRTTMMVAIPGTKIFKSSHSGHQSGNQYIFPSERVGAIVAVNESIFTFTAPHYLRFKNDDWWW